MASSEQQVNIERLIQPEAQRSLSQEVHNISDVAARTAAATPKAFMDELAADFSQRPAVLVTHVVEGAVVGAAATALLKMPKVAPIVGLGVMACTGLEAVSGLGHFASEASRADSSASREAFAQKSAQKLGAGLSTMVESAPGMIAGGALTARSFGAPPLFNRASDLLDRKFIAPVKESLAFRGPGSMPLSTKLVGSSDAFDALNAGKMLAARHPWQGVETGSTVDLARMRLSRTVGGLENSLKSLPGAQGKDAIPFHTHGPDALVGHRPSLVDIAATKNLGIIQQGAKTTYYVGEGTQYAGLEKLGRGEFFSPELRAVVVDHENGVAERLTGQFIVDRGWQLDKPVRLDLARTLETLGRIRTSTPWQDLINIPSAAAKAAAK